MSLTLPERPVASRRADAQVVARVPLNGGGTAEFIRRVPAPAARRRSFRTGDIRETLLVASCFLGGVLLPVRYWHRLIRAVVALGLSGVRSGKFAESFRPAFEAVTGASDPENVRDAFEAFRGQTAAWRMLAVREALPGRRNHPEIEVSGLPQLQASLSDGGALVWANQFFPQTICGKRALWEAGLKAVQVTAEAHGFRDSAYGKAVLNPVLIRAETKYLARRLIIRHGTEATVTRGVLRSLAEGRVVIVTNNDYAGATFVELPFGRSGIVAMATTIPRLAIRHGKPLFSMTAIELEPFTRYRVHIAPLYLPENDATDAGDEHARIAEIVATARDRLLEHVLQAPDQYMAWLRAIVDDADDD